MLVPTDWEEMSGVQQWMRFHDDIWTCRGWSIHCTDRPEVRFARLVDKVGTLETMCQVCFEVKKQTLESVKSDVMVLAEDEFNLLAVMAL